MVEKSCRQVLEATGHITFFIRTHRDECLYAILFLLFIQSRTPAYGITLSTFRVGLSTSFSYRNAQSHVSQVTLDPVKFTVNINYQKGAYDTCFAQEMNEV